MKHVIIGNGPAGVVAAETVRKRAPHDSITMLGDEPEPPYSRMALPYLLVGNIGEDGTYLRKSENHFEKLGIELKRAHATNVDSAKREVRLDSGDVLSYDRLLIATGVTPNRPRIPGIDLPNVLPCWTLADARRILELAKPGAKVLQMGAGFIGCIIMEALAERGVDLTVVEAGNRMVPRMMTEGAGAMIKAWCERKGIKVLTDSKVTSIEPHGVRLETTLDKGNVLDCDVVISATGVVPNIGFLDGSGIDCDQGVIVDNRMETNVSGVFAAGDVAQSPEFPSGQRVINAIQPVAVDEARIAGTNMTGGSVGMPGNLAMNVLDTLGLVASSFGQWMGVPKEQGGSSVELRDDGKFRYIRLEFKDDVLIGATTLGYLDHVGVIRGLIQGRVRLGRWKQELHDNPTRLMDAYLASAQRPGVRPLA
jgi:NADPH-dependent 2,4-dienoyl-CoA reductase/sulfur reductase-like enzyme